MRLIRGAPGAGKTALVFREFKEALTDDGAAPRIVAPTATLVRHFQHELARDGCVFAPSAVISLNRFIAERALPLQPAPEGLVRLIVRHTLRRLGLPEFEQVAETSGMASTVADTISLFENAGCTPGKLASARRLSAQARAFEKVWRRVEEELRDRGFETRPAVVRAAAQKGVRERIWMDGFVSFSPLEKELVGALAQTCDLTLTATDTRAGDELRLLALGLGASERLLTGPARKPPVAVVAASSIEREVDEIARRIIELGETGTAFREIAVAIRDERSYLALLRSTFERFGIPARFYFSSALKLQPAVQFLGGLIACALGGWEHGAALEALRAHPGWGASPAFDRFDFAVREAMPGRGLESLEALAEVDLDSCFTVNSWRNELLIPAAWKARMEQFLAARFRPGMLDAPRDFSAVETQRNHVAAVRAVAEALGHAVEFFGNAAEPMELADFWPAAAEAIETASLPIADERRNVVHVINAFEARQWDVTALFVCGMTDRDYPRKNPQNLLFSDAEIEPLRKAGIPLRRASDLDGEEQGLFESLKNRAVKAVVLTYPLHDSGGASVDSSRLLVEMNAVAGAPVPCQATPALAAPAPGLAGRLDSEAVLAALGERHRVIGISALEDLVQCRFKFFAGKTLGLKGRPDRPHERLEARAKGLILHKALEEWLNAGRSGAFTAAFETAFENACQENHLPPGYRLELERIFLRAVAQGVSATDRWVGETETEVELTLDFPGGITVRGRVDRIDRLNERDCIIVDYKSGAVPNVSQLIHSPAKLQGPLYALAAREQLNLNTVAMMYMAIRSDKLFGWGAVPGVELGLEPMPPRWMEDARDRAVERLGSLLSGAIQADPLEPEKCRWCDFAGACHYTREAALVEVARGA
ncbi:MAG: PD-(D/E)XK nuclease family protein [Terriglobia bacterium]